MNQEAYLLRSCWWQIATVRRWNSSNEAWNNSYLPLEMVESWPRVLWNCYLIFLIIASHYWLDEMWANISLICFSLDEQNQSILRLLLLLLRILNLFDDLHFLMCFLLKKLCLIPNFLNNPQEHKWVNSCLPSPSAYLLICKINLFVWKYMKTHKPILKIAKKTNFFIHQKGELIVCWIKKTWQDNPGTLNITFLQK